MTALLMLLVLLAVPLQAAENPATANASNEETAELVRNGGFDELLPDGQNEAAPVPGWKLIPIEASAQMALDGTAPSNENHPTALKVTIEGLAPNNIATVMLENNGFSAIPVQKGKTYRLTLSAKSDGIESFGVVIPKQEGDILAEGKIDSISGEWQKFELLLNVSDDCASGRLCFSIPHKGTLWLDDVSLIPAETSTTPPNDSTEQAALAEQAAATEQAALTADSNAAPSFRAIRFKVDVTPALGLDMAYCPNEKVDMPIYVGGVILDDGATRVVWCTSDYINIYGDTYVLWREKIAEAADCPVENVFLHAVHQHDSMRVAPEYNPPAGTLDKEGNPEPLAGSDPEYAAKSLADVTNAIRTAVQSGSWQSIETIQTAETRVGGLASNRRLVDASGVGVTMRWTMCIDPELQAWPTGVIDPMLRTVALIEPDGTIFAALHFYASHPQSAYLRKMVSGDVPGWAIRYACEKTPDTLHFYFNGCGGNVTFGKYNPTADAGAIEKLGTRLGEYLVTNLSRLEERKNGPIELHRAGLSVPFNPDAVNPDQATWGDRAFLEKTLSQWRAATITRFSVGEVNILSIGLSEVCVEYQLYAQSLVPENFLATAAYTNGVYKYMPPAKAFDEGGYESSNRACVVTREIEPVLQSAIREALSDLIAHPGWTGAPVK